jgi:hypothetical protein
MEHFGTKWNTFWEPANVPFSRKWLLRNSLWCAPCGAQSRGSEAKLPARTIVDTKAAYRMAMPWKKVEEIELKTTGPQNRLQIMTEIRCSAEPAQELRELLEADN